MFETLIGNNGVKIRLQKLLSANRMPNALLFSGPDGVGKKQFALEIARSFVCSADAVKRPCGVCPACRRATEFDLPKADDRDAHKLMVPSRHSDIKLVIPYKRNILIDAIRDLEREANFRPFEAKARFFVIDDADKMNDAASNALLKTLEEPPATSYLFLIASRPDKLLPTIRSRTQHVRFAPVAADEIESLLSVRGNFSAADAALAARLSGGSIGRAMGTEIERHKAQRQVMFDVLNAALSRDRVSLLQTAEMINSAKYKDDFEVVLGILESLVRDVWLARNGVGREGFVNIDIASDIEHAAGQTGSADLARWLDEIETMRGNFAININRKSATDALFISMAA